MHFQGQYMLECQSQGPAKRIGSGPSCPKARRRAVALRKLGEWEEVFWHPWMRRQMGAASTEALLSVMSKTFPKCIE